MVRNYKIILQYDGSRYDGWQKQGNTEKTVQGKLEQVLERLSGSPVVVHGSGRTDAGVHAHGQTANFHMETELSEKELMQYLNQYLPEDIEVLSLDIVKDRFHSRLNAVEKTYVYHIEMGPKKDVFQRKYIYGLGKELDIERMEEAAVSLMGSHDFKSFCANKKMKKSTVRTLTDISFCQKGTKLTVSYTGDGFLHHMVRILMGTLIEVGLGERKPEEMKEILLKEDRQAAGYTAPAEGLFLERVVYDD